MSILSVMPCVDWYYEPADDLDFDYADLAVYAPTEALTAADGVVWWSAAAVTDDEE